MTRTISNDKIKLIHNKGREKIKWFLLENTMS